MGSIWTMGEILVEIMRPGTEMPFHLTGEFVGPLPSGAPAIFIDTVAKLGHNAGIIGGVGNDGFGRNVLERLKRDGVNCENVLVVNDKATAVAFVAYFEDGSRKYIFHVDGTPAVMTPSLKEMQIRGVDFFHIMGCSLLINEKFRKKIMETADVFYQNRAHITFDPNIRVELLGNRDIYEIFTPIMEKCSIFFPGVDELRFISNGNDLQACVDNLFERYDLLELIILKRGKNGSTIYSRKKKIELPAFEVVEVDPTGAGDCFDAGFLSALLEGKDLFTAGKIATITGALNAASFGPMEGKIDPKTIKEMLEREGLG
ncbi:MAG: sugar kinase [Thermotogae bacterium]|nr:sugar kinase [Thermotogota bacterium]